MPRSRRGSERISRTGRATVRCIFHHEKGPSLVIWPDGGFFCHGCHRGGRTEDYPQLTRKYRQLQGPVWNLAQCCFPWAGVRVLDMDEVIEGPKPTGRRAEVSLTGGLMPWDKGQPALLNVPGSTANYLPVFTSTEALRELMAKANVDFDSIKKIEDGPEFLASIPIEIKIMLDPYFTSNGKVRWVEVLRD